METRLLVQLGAIAVLLLGSAFFSGSETALFSLSRLSREALASRTDAGSRNVLALLSEPRRLIVTIILCNEVINISASSLAATVTAGVLRRAPEAIQVLVSTVVLVPLLLLFGEVTPKSLAVRSDERWARAVARLLAACSVLVAPVRFILQTIADGVLRLFGVRPLSPDVGLREEEFRALVDMGSEEGEVEIAERRLIHNVFEFGDRAAGQVMTPADRVFSLPYEMPLGRLVEAVAKERFSRVPIYRGSGRRGARDQVVGILLAKDLVGYARGQLEGHTIQDLLHPPLFVPLTTKCDRLFRQFQRRKTHIALVVDEYGRLAGLVTMEDLLEELFGEIADEKEGRP